MLFRSLCLQPFSRQKRDHTHRNLDKMRQQKNMFQMKEQDKNPEERLSEVEIQIESNENNDDARSWKEIVGTDREDTRNV